MNTIQIRRYEQMDVSNLLTIDKETDDLIGILKEADDLADQMDVNRSSKIHVIVKPVAEGRYSIYVPFEKKCTHIPGQCKWKQRLFISLAVKARYEGSLTGFFSQIGQIEEYLKQNKMTAISEYYCMFINTKARQNYNYDEVIIDAYVGISNNIL